MSEGQQRSSTKNLSRRIAPQIPQNTAASVKALAEQVNCHRDCLTLDCLTFLSLHALQAEQLDEGP